MHYVQFSQKLPKNNVVLKSSQRGWTFILITYRISSYNALPRMIPAILICNTLYSNNLMYSRNVVFSNKIRFWRRCKIMILASLIWGNTIMKIRSDLVNILLKWIIGRFLKWFAMLVSNRTPGQNERKTIKLGLPSQSLRQLVGLFFNFSSQISKSDNI